MGAKSKKERSVPASTTNYGGSNSDVGTSRATSGSTGKDDRLEQLQADHELFLQAFESMKFCLFASYLIKQMFLTRYHCTRLNYSQNIYFRTNPNISISKNKEHG